MQIYQAQKTSQPKSKCKSPSLFQGKGNLYQKEFLTSINNVRQNQLKNSIASPVMKNDKINDICINHFCNKTDHCS
jgi:hypothetical protein